MNTEHLDNPQSYVNRLRLPPEVKIKSEYYFKKIIDPKSNYDVSFESASSNKFTKPAAISLDKFDWKIADRSRALLQDTYRIRYAVYCLDRGFLDPDRYAYDLEYDEYDGRAQHLAICHRKTGRMTATARIIVSEASPVSRWSLPLRRHCELWPEVQKYLGKHDRIGEVSRLAMCKDSVKAASQCEPNSSLRLSAILTLYKGIYQSTRCRDIHMLVAAMEKPLWRLMQKFHFPFRQIGPVTDYYGPVAPYILDLNELDVVLSQKSPWLLKEFRHGLEMEGDKYRELPATAQRAA